MWHEFAAMLMLGLCGLAAWRYTTGLQSRINVSIDQAERSAALRRQLYWWVQANERLVQWQQVTESSIDGGTRAVRALHKGIAAIPFEILAAIPVTRDTSKVVRSVHDFAADNVYAAIAAVNRMAGERSRARLQPSASKRGAEKPDPSAVTVQVLEAAPQAQAALPAAARPKGPSLLDKQALNAALPDYIVRGSDQNKS